MTKSFSVANPKSRSTGLKPTITGNRGCRLSGRKPQIPVYGTETVAGKFNYATSWSHVANPKSRSTGLKQSSWSYTSTLRKVANPKSRSTGLKQFTHSLFR